MNKEALKRVGVVALIILVTIGSLVYTKYQADVTATEKQELYAKDTASLRNQIKLLKDKNADLLISYNLVLSKLDDCQEQSKIERQSPKELIRDIQHWDRSHGYYPQSIEGEFNVRKAYINDDGNVRRVTGFVPTKTEFSDAKPIGEISGKSNKNPVSKFGDFQ